MKLLFVHQNFPGQFKHLAPALAAMPGNEVRALAMHGRTGVAGIRVVNHKVARQPGQNLHPWLRDAEAKVLRGESAYRAAQAMRKEGFNPDVIVAHPGWGESLFLKEVWPDARLGIYSEFFYRASGADVGFDPEFPPKDPDDACRLRGKNINSLMHFDIADAGLSPTHWQASTFPEPFRSRITVAHDGIDTDAVRPDPAITLTLNGQNGKVCLTREDEVITFVNRNLEPYRGYHIFMRALPEILRARPKARVLIVGGDGVSYGAAAPDGKSWREIFLAEVSDQIDLRRVHFLGHLPYSQFLALLQLSSVHVYLTYPFVLSWSLLEAMSAGCAIVASDTAPVREAIVPNQTGRLVDFFAPAALAAEVVALSRDAETRQRLGAAARDFAQQHYDLHSICLPKQKAWVEALAG